MLIQPFHPRQDCREGQHSQPLQVGQGLGSTQPFLFGRWGGQHTQPLQVGQRWAALRTSSGGSGVGGTHNLFRWVRGGQHSHSLFRWVRGGQHHNLFMWGHEWAAHRTSFYGRMWAASQPLQVGQRSGQHSQLFRWISGGQHSQPLHVGQDCSSLTTFQMDQWWAALTTSSGVSGVGSTHNSSGGEVVGSTHNLFRWLTGGQHSQPRQVGHRWAALTTCFRGQKWAALTTYSDGSGMRSTHNSLVV